MTKVESKLLAAQAAARRPPLGRKLRTLRALQQATTEALRLYCRRQARRT